MSLFISFASLDGIHVNQHFGWCEKFYMYKIDTQSYTFVTELDASLEVEEESDKLNYKIECLGRTQIVCVSQIGPKAATLVQARGIYPMRSKNEEEKIEDVLKTLQTLLNGTTPLWLKRIVLKNES